MKPNSDRSFNCKDEELPVVCRFGALSLARDLSDFTAYSPVFDLPYLNAFKAKIEVVQELVQPLAETVQLKVINERIYQTLDDLITPVNHLEGYLKLAGKQVPVSSTDFGLVQLRKSVRKRDVESVLKQLKTVDGNIQQYKTELTAKGLTDSLSAKFKAAVLLLTEDKDKKYTLVSNRYAVVQNNRGLLSNLYNQLTEIYSFGKTIYKQSNKAKLKDYTFAQAMTQVRKSTNSETLMPEAAAKIG
jgi:hypothetical protein